MQSHRQQRIFNLLFFLVLLHSIFYTVLLISWVGHYSDLKLVMGWIHGTTWIAMTVLMLAALKARIVPWTLTVLVAVIGPLIPLVGALGFIHVKRNTRTAN